MVRYQRMMHAWLIAMNGYLHELPSDYHRA